jgi:hypothetical protein
MGIKGDVIAIGIAGAVLLAAGWYAKRKLAGAATAISNAAQQALPYINPADRNNVAYSGVNALGGALTGDSSWSLGGWLYDISHGGANPTTAAPPSVVLDPNFGILNPISWE